MVLVGTKLKVIDNSGLSYVRCLKIMGVNNRKYALPGDLVLVSRLKGKPVNQVLDKSKVYKGLVSRVRYRIRRLGGEVISFEDNGVVLLKSDGVPLGTRVLGPIMKELREKRFMKIVSLALICI